MISQGFITREGLTELKNYSYKSSQYTWFDLKVNVFWEWCASMLPPWLAPNLITFIGWVFVMASYICMLCYDFTFQKDIPRFLFFFAALCIFIYSTLDAIDGKQARKTKSSSPLGQLFDHGCDSFSSNFFILAVCQATKLGNTEVFVFFASTQFAYFYANWTQYNTGVLMTAVGQFGVTESEFVCMIIHLLTSIFGQDVWLINLSEITPSAIASAPLIMDLDSKYDIMNIKLNTIVVMFFSALTMFCVLFENTKSILKSNNRIRMSLQCFTIYLMLAIEAIWFNLGFFGDYVGIVLTSFGLINSLIICKIIISSVSKMRLNFFHQEVIPTLIATVLLMGCQYLEQFEAQKNIFWALFVINLGMIFHFIYNTVNQITLFLEIYCFSLQKKKQH